MLFLISHTNLSKVPFDSGHFGASQNRRMPKSALVKIRAGQNPRRKKNEPTLLYSALITLRLSVNHYYKQVISAQSQ